MIYTLTCSLHKLPVACDSHEYFRSWIDRTSIRKKIWLTLERWAAKVALHDHGKREHRGDLSQDVWARSFGSKHAEDEACEANGRNRFELVYPLTFPLPLARSVHGREGCQAVAALPEMKMFVGFGGCRGKESLELDPRWTDVFIASPSSHLTNSGADCFC